MSQLDLFGALRRAPVLEACDPDGAVVAAPEIRLRLPHPRLAWDLAAIQLHPHEDGRWMWAVQHACGGYRVGPKWGRFAPTQAEARHFAAGELLDWCARVEGHPDRAGITPAQLRQIASWAEGLL